MWRLGAVGILLLFICNEVLSLEPPKPNIVLIMADDLGFNDVGFHGSDQIPTPNIDALGAYGINLNRYYVTPMCSPSRASLMTGKCKIMPEYLKEAGYKTHIVGKWHLGYYKKEYTPTLRGFDSHIGYLCGMIDYYNHSLTIMVSILDDGVGRVVKALKKRKMLDNTIILFFADNGAPIEIELKNAGSNMPLRGQKESPWEGAVRSAAVIWSSLLKNRERTSNQLFHISDWLPTFAALAGVTVDRPIDGKNIWEALSMQKRFLIVSGVDEPEETNLQKLLEGVASLQDSGATVASRSVYRNKQRSEADSIRAAAAESFQSEVESEELDLGAPMSETNAPTSENKAPASENNAPMTANNVATMLNDRFRAMEQERSIKFFFSDNGDSDDVECENDDLSGRLNYHRKDKIGSSRRQNPKQDLVRYLKTELTTKKSSKCGDTSTVGMQKYVIAPEQPFSLGLCEKILPEYLKEAGYKTHIVGKWHLGYYKKAYTPTLRGFDSHIGYLGAMIDFYNHKHSLRFREWL
ncbi:Arylsulfatase B [Pseudolycoriella hygida]|uniref:Arylsulfatase B n=1 Tax=Pseudolycoriella hygida TaxID=35572 RepID=A0A9Q0S9E0_9DIPT|nr:Arylsulfatase B [Pseudolycoriella hygida]